MGDRCAPGQGDSGLVAGKLARHASDFCCRDAGQLGYFFRRELFQYAGKTLKAALRASGILFEESFFKDDVGHGKRNLTLGSGARGQPFVGIGSRKRKPSAYINELASPSRASLAKMPQPQVIPDGRRVCFEQIRPKGKKVLGILKIVDFQLSAAKYPPVRFPKYGNPRRLFLVIAIGTQSCKKLSDEFLA